MRNSFLHLPAFRGLPEACEGTTARRPTARLWLHTATPASPHLLTYTHSVSLSLSLLLHRQQHTAWEIKNMTMKRMMTGAMRKRMICLCDLCKCSAFSPLKYIFISKHSVVCIHLRQLWIPSQPWTSELNEKRHLKGNTKGAQLKQLSAALSVFYLEYNLLKIYGFFHRSHFSPLGTKWSDWPQKQREQLFLLHI